MEIAAVGSCGDVADEAGERSWRFGGVMFAVRLILQMFFHVVWRFIARKDHGWRRELGFEVETLEEGLPRFRGGFSFAEKGGHIRWRSSHDLGSCTRKKEKGKEL